MWNAVLRAGVFLGRLQAALVLSLLYLLLLWPLGLLVRLQDPLGRRKGGWVPRRMPDPTLERFSHPF